MIQPFRPIRLVPKNLATHRRSNLLSRSRGISMTTTPGSWPSPRPARSQCAECFKGPRQNARWHSDEAAPLEGVGGAKQPHRRVALSYARGSLSSTVPGMRSKISTEHYCPHGHPNWETLKTGLDFQRGVRREQFRHGFRSRRGPSRPVACSYWDTKNVSRRPGLTAGMAKNDAIGPIANIGQPNVSGVTFACRGA